MSAATRPRAGRSGVRRTLVGVLTAVAAAVTPMLAVPATAHAAGESVQVYLTTTNDSGGRNVTKGLEQQAPLTFGSGTGGSGQNVTVDENTQYQQFTGGGASFTDTAAYDLNSSGALSAATRNSVMQKLFDPVNGIGLDFLRNPMGASDLARNNYTYDDMPAGQTDPTLANFSIAHDLTDVVPLTKQARQLNPNVTVMATPWTPPPWMKDNDAYSQGWLQSQYYGAYAQYFVKYLQAYQAQGVPVELRDRAERADLLQRLPVGASGTAPGWPTSPRTTCCRRCTPPGCPPRSWRSTGTGTRYDSYAAPTVDDASDPQRPQLRRHRLARLRGRRRRADHDPQPVPERAGLRHRALRRHVDRQPAEGGHGEPDRLHPQLGPELGQVEPGGRSEHGPAQRRLRHLHRPGHRAQR